MGLWPSIAAFGVWPALFVTGAWLLRQRRQATKDPFPAITTIALWWGAGMVVWSGVLLVVAAVGLYRGEYLGVVGWAVVLLALMKQRAWRWNFSLAWQRLSIWEYVLVIGVVFSTAMNLYFATESIVGGRDPGVYANYGISIAHRGSLAIPFPWPSEAASALASAFQEFPGIVATPSHMTILFPQLFPVWLAQVFSSFGQYGVFRLNVILAFLSACVFYGACRAIVLKPYAVIATLFFMLNPSQIWMARITLTEILTQLFLWSGLLLLCQSLKTSDRRFAIWAGIFLGCSAFVRIDSFLLVPLLLVSHGLWKMIVPSNDRGASRVWSAFYWAVLPMVVVSLGYYAVFNLTYLSIFADELQNIALVSGIGAILVVLPLRIVERMRSLLLRKPVFLVVCFLVVGCVGYAYWIRPTVQSYATIHQPGHFLDGTRDYRELSLVNLARYISPFVLFSATLGWLVSLYSVMFKRDSYFLVPLLIITCGFSALYIWKPSIAPDHFWAIRRFVPVVIPGFILFASFGVWWMMSKLSKVQEILVGIVIAGFLCLFTLRADKAVLAFAENKGLFEQLQRFAQHVPMNEPVLAYDASGWARWTTPLFLSFDRRVIPIRIHTESEKRLFDQWVTQRLAKHEVVYFLSAGEALAFADLQSKQIEKVILQRSFIETIVDPLPQRILYERTPLILYKIEGKREKPDYTDVNLGTMRVFGVKEEGFYGQDWSRDGQVQRWTNGTARLSVPLRGRDLPKAIKIDLASVGPRGTTIRVVVNGYELVNQKIPGGSWAQTLNLGDGPFKEQLTIELLSDTFVPLEVIPGSTDQRTLGVYVSDIRLLS
jgi:hypothetical protein